MNTNASKNLAGSMDPGRYMQERVDDQLSWYSKKSTMNKNWHHRLQLLTLVAAASIPVISLSSAELNVRIIVAIIGSITAISAGIVTLYQFKDQWVDYRSTAEQLKYEKYLYLTGSKPYNDSNSFSVFVNRVENIIIQENRGWQEKLVNQSLDSDNASDLSNSNNRKSKDDQ